jgi:hypothetical protein
MSWHSANHVPSWHTFCGSRDALFKSNIEAAMITCDPRVGLATDTELFYRRSLQVLTRAEVQFLVGGAYALAAYTGIERHTKDLDVFLRQPDCARALHALAGAGYATEVTFPHWLAKAYHNGDFIDVIFSSGNGVAHVDDDWFRHANPGEVLGEQVRLCPIEETLWSKGFIMERERYDGADIAHLLRVRGHSLDWNRLLWRYGDNWRVLLSHLVLFGYIYPGERSRIPQAVMAELFRRLQKESGQTPPPEHVCRGTFLSREQYLPDVNRWGYEDPRRHVPGTMTDSQIARWTDAIYEDK